MFRGEKKEKENGLGCVLAGKRGKGNGPAACRPKLLVFEFVFDWPVQIQIPLN
jgi:hypothetical protein